MWGYIGNYPNINWSLDSLSFQKDEASSVLESFTIGLEFKLLSPAPNPFNPLTAISYQRPAL